MVSVARDGGVCAGCGDGRNYWNRNRGGDGDRDRDGFQFDHNISIGGNIK